MTLYEVKMKHNETTFEQLSRMQYDLFCRGNRVGRTILSIAAIVFGLSNSSSWWGILVIAYGCYIMTSTYSAPNHTAHKLVKQLKEAGLDFPHSMYQFDEKVMRIISLPDRDRPNPPLAYGDIARLGEDANYYYIFRDQYGGYMIPKAELGRRSEEFRAFIERKTEQRFRYKAAPVIKFINRLSRGNTKK